MNKIMLITMIVVLSACTTKVPGHIVENAVKVCAQNGNVSYIEYYGQRDADFTKVTCTSSRQFKLKAGASTVE